MYRGMVEWLWMMEWAWKKMGIGIREKCDRSKCFLIIKKFLINWLRYSVSASYYLGFNFFLFLYLSLTGFFFVQKMYEFNSYRGGCLFVRML